MSSTATPLSLCLALLAGAIAAAPVKAGDDLTLWYRGPATEWTEALPVGNGRLGAMVFGGTHEERIQLNEESVWAGPPVPEPRAGSAPLVREARQAWFDGDYARCHALLERIMSPRISPRSHQTLGDLRLRFASEGEVTGYRRALDLDAAVATTRFTADGVTYTREVLSSAPDQVLAVRLTSEPPGHLTFDLALDRPVDATTAVVGNHTLVLTGQAQHGGTQLGTRFAARLRVRVDDELGTVSAGDGALRVEGAGSVTLLLAASTDYNRNDTARPLAGDPGERCAETLAAVGAKPWADLRSAHEADHRAFFRRVALDLGGGDAVPSPHRRAPGGGARGRLGPGPGGALLPVRPLPPDRLLASGGPARQSPGPLERAHRGPLERRLPHQHQHPDELLAGGGDQPLGVPRSALRLRRAPGALGTAHRARGLRRAGLRRPPHDRRLALDRPHRQARVGPLAARRRLVLPALHGALPLHRATGVPARPGPGRS